MSPSSTEVRSAPMTAVGAVFTGAGATGAGGLTGGTSSGSQVIKTVQKAAMMKVFE